MRSLLAELVVRFTNDLETHDLAGHRFVQPTREERISVAIERDGKQVPLALVSLREVLAELANPDCDDAPADEASA